MNITIPTNKEKYHRQLLEIIKILPPLNKLSPKELKLLGAIMREYNKYANLPEEEAAILTFSKTNRKALMEELQISPSNMNTYLVKMRKLGILAKNNVLKQSLRIPYKTIDVSFKLELK